VLGGSLFCLPSSAHAQGADLLSDPFNFYYAFYLPNQQMQAMRPRPIDTLNQAVAARQYYAQNDRRALYNPISPNGEQTYDPLHPYSGQNQERLAKPFRFSQNPSNSDGSGPSLARRLRTEQRTREVPIIMLTARAAEDDKVAGLDSGVDDYVTKPFSPRELEARIQAVLRRRLPQLSKEAVEIEGLVLNPATRVVSGKSRTLKMGPTEFELLHFFMTHTDRVYTRAQILDQVWGDHVFLEDRTVDVHIRRLREALSPSGHDRLVETVRGAGYRFRSSD